MTKADGIEFFIDKYKLHTTGSTTTDQTSLLDAILSKVDTYDVWYDKYYKGVITGQTYKSFDIFYNEFHRSVRKALHNYSPEFSFDLVKEGKVEVNATNKKGDKTGKRTAVKFGRWLGQAFPFLTDVQKEKLTVWYMDNHSPISATFYRRTTGFESVVTKLMGKRVGFNTTIWQKSLADSCMRYSAEDLGLSEHPYSAYESGDWELCYLLDDNGKLLGRCLVNLPTGTHSAIYGTSISAVKMLREEMNKLGYTQVSEDASEWDGSKLLYIEDNWYNNDEDSDFPVHLMPYVDIFEGYAYHDRKYIYLSVSSDRPFNSYYVDPFEASGFNEI